MTFENKNFANFGSLFDIEVFMKESQDGFLISDQSCTYVWMPNLKFKSCGESCFMRIKYMYEFIFLLSC